MDRVKLGELRAIIASLPDELATFSLTDGSGGGEPDYLDMGHDVEYTWRVAEICGYQGDDARETLEKVLQLAQAVPQMISHLEALEKNCATLLLQRNHARALATKYCYDRDEDPADLAPEDHDGWNP